MNAARAVLYEAMRMRDGSIAVSEAADLFGGGPEAADALTYLIRLGIVHFAAVEGEMHLAPGRHPT